MNPVELRADEIRVGDFLISGEPVVGVSTESGVTTVRYLREVAESADADSRQQVIR